jgi:magnesium-protoporphyrin O-methyltransferase
MLTVMHSAGKLFPRGDRSPAIEPVTARTIRRRIAADPRMNDWAPGRSERISSGFYISCAQELVRT